MKKFLFLFLLFSITFTTFSQECKDFYLKCATNQKEFWQINEKSESGKVKPGESIVIDMVILKGKDYRISVCGDDIAGNILNLTIKNRNGLIMYDNINDNYGTQFTFSCLETQDVIISVSIPDSNAKIEGCAGVLIEDMLSVQSGF